MVLLVTSHILAAALLLGLGARLGRRGTIAAALVVPGVAAAWFASQIGGVLDGAERSQRWTWLPDLDVALSFRLDGFALLMALVVTGMGTLVLAYSGSYFGPEVPLERLSRFAGGFVAFAGAMLGLVLADDTWTLFIFWEATTITSFVLIGLDHEGAGARSAAQQALLVTGAGGLALFGGLALLADAAGTTSLAGLSAAPATAVVVQVGLVLVLVGAFTKSAQFPFQFWLPGAMAAPTPVSAFLHSATMVKAGVVLVGRLAPLFAEVSWWRPTLVVVGGLTMLTGGISALRQHDAKLLLAHGTVSQLGLLMVLFGLGHPATTAAGVALLVGHALFKAALFLAVGIVDHATGSRDIRRLTGVGRRLPWVAAMTAVAAASMVGLPPLLGFVAKEAALDALVEEGDAWSVVALVVVVVGSVLTTAYSARLWFGLFSDGPGPTDEPATVRHPPSVGLTGPVGVLVGLTIAGGLLAGPLGDRLGVASEALDPAAEGHLTLWAGLHLPLFLSVGIVAAGAGLHLLLARSPGLPAARLSGTRAFQSTLDGLLVGARRVTAIVQSGSLPAYMAVVFVVLIAAMTAAFVGGAGIGPGGTSATGGSVLQAAVAVLAAAMAAAMVVARRRFVAVLMLGAVGYAMAAIFMLYGAPDLALTQVLVETITLVVFLLVLRHLPEGYSPPPEWAPRAVRIAISLAVGLGVATFALVAGTARTTSPVADEIVARSEPDAGGRNVVNVILVDVRGVDTLGEITVLAIAAAGVANLVRAARRDHGAGTDPLGDPHLSGAGPQPDPPDAIGARSVIFDQVSRAVFTLILLVSVYVTLRGHNAPGGGFAGGLIAGMAFVMRYLAAGSPHLRRPRALPTSGLIATGLLLAVGTGLTAAATGEEFLTSSIAEVGLPLIGTVKLVSSTVFDIGVYVLVLGVVLSVLTHLGSESSGHPPGLAEPGASPRAGAR
ncbi:hydrogen gas-evolving membrane-bound hydrogenase subunit E [Iamia sp.]|uniref:hydrogen gas-evolving membrane-bound hydrogenase subunit E n=1 Tax=Iamia sp. TaxID=2722710 RepID=UPI002C455A48|nr:hydrogen gas-evolving membrane-bound hydrogenase subunit E [Iamia sp.]HXH57512.1 hydrogen gas-evolving membrane-bound hydrogenase subunit E [Iamia sp.]